MNPQDSSRNEAQAFASAQFTWELLLSQADSRQGGSDVQDDFV